MGGIDDYEESEEDEEDISEVHAYDQYMYIDWDRFTNGKELVEHYIDEGYLRSSYNAVELSVTWVHEPSKFGYKDTVAAWGNEPTIDVVYSAGCLLVHIG